MTGYIDSAPGGAIGVEAKGVMAVPASTGEVLGAAAGAGLAHAFPSFELNRQMVEQGIPADEGEAFGRALAGAPASGFAPGPGVLDPEETTRKYGIDGRLKWTMPVPENVAAEQSARMHETLGRESAIARREGGIMTGGVARFAAGLAGGLPGLVDPLNITASFLPVVPEARAALWAARGGLAGRAATGAIEGAAGQAALLPYQAILAKGEGEDFGATEALLNIALGGVFGGGLHLLGGLGRRGARLGADIEAMTPESRESLLRGGVADLAEGRRVETPAEAYDYIRNTGGPKPYERVPAEPTRLGDFLRQRGGLRDEAGELASRDAGVRGRAKGGLINPEGMTLDDAALHAWEAGYLPGAERPDINALLDALDRDRNQMPVYSDHDRAAVAEHQAALDGNTELDRLAQEHGVPLAGSRDAFMAAIAAKLGPQQAAAEAERLAASHAALMRQAADEGWLPDFGEGAPTTPEEIADAYRQDQAARRAREGEGGNDRPEALRGAARADETGLRPGGGGPGARRAAEPGILPSELTAEAARPAEQQLADELAALDREIAQAEAAGEATPDAAALAAADEAAAFGDAVARAIEQGGNCLGRRS